MTFVAVVISMSLYLCLHMSVQLFHSPQSPASICYHDCQILTRGAEIQRWLRPLYIHSPYTPASLPWTLVHKPRMTSLVIQLWPRYVRTMQGNHAVYTAFSQVHSGNTWG
ncbi:hypothetical protein K439DRAFT_1612849 [Ramaria rubella]|nr:hypothetical protein K439DRAFT_1612849 [Ramaria rubella]